MKRKEKKKKPTKTVNKTKISECISVQHWCHFSRRNKTKTSVSLYLLLLCCPSSSSASAFLHLHCHCHCWLAHSSFVNCHNRTAPQWSLLMFYIFSRPDICIRSASNYLYFLDTMVCYPPTFQNLVPLNPDEHKNTGKY